MKRKRKLDLAIVERRKGLTSKELAENCPDSRIVFPSKPCTNVGCEYAIKQTAYLNCTFVAAEAGEHTLEAIGEMMGLTREGVRVIELRALRKVREALHEAALHESCVATGSSDLGPNKKVTQRKNRADLVLALDG